MSRGNRVQKKRVEQQRLLARRHVLQLFARADVVFGERPDLADRYVRMARRIAMRYQLRLPSVLRRRFCKFCYRFFVPGVTGRVRVHQHRVVYSCWGCGRQWRLPLSRTKDEKGRVRG